MPCDYYIDSYTTIEYISETGRFNKLTTDLSREQKYINRIFDNVFEDENEDYLLYRKQEEEKKIERKIEKHTRLKMIYINGEWSSERYKNIFMQRLKREFQYIHEIKKIYIKCIAFKSLDAPL
jgi:phosphoenolpyruvate synthase/pyruvate phosphate dikinase